MKLRSLLFVPGDSEKKLTKAIDLDADVLILDLEDAVAPDNRPRARALINDYLQARESSSALWVRINPIDQPDALDDLAGIMAGRPDGIIQPKTTSPEDVRVLGHYLAALEAAFGLAVGSTSIIPVATETPRAMFTMGDFVDADERLLGITWGAEDLGAAVGASTNLEADGTWTSPYRLARSLCLFAANARGVTAIDTVYPDFRDPEGLRRCCEEARRDGFHGKIAIHPDQVAVINAAFTPSEEEREYARRVVEVFAANPGAGTLSLDGKMLDAPHLKQARKILEAGV
jgi:citrate lyase subunit beta/citryl-CoA lyase